VAVKLHRCSWTWLKGPHTCWRVQKALDEAGIEYGLVIHPALPRSRRRAYIALTGQRLLPAIEREDGTIIREESKDLAERVRDGRLDSQ
jgi:glutathione S-transferase